MRCVMSRELVEVDHECRKRIVLLIDRPLEGLRCEVEMDDQGIRRLLLRLFGYQGSFIVFFFEAEVYVQCVYFEFEVDVPYFVECFGYIS